MSFVDKINGVLFKKKKENFEKTRKELAASKHMEVTTNPHFLADVKEGKFTGVKVSDDEVKDYLKKKKHGTKADDAAQKAKEKANKAAAKVADKADSEEETG